MADRRVRVAMKSSNSAEWKRSILAYEFVRTFLTDAKRFANSISVCVAAARTRTRNGEESKTAEQNQI